MTKQVIFEITIKGDTLQIIASKLHKLGLKVLPYTRQEVGESAYDPNNIIIIGYFPDSLALEFAMGQMNTILILTASFVDLDSKIIANPYNHKSLTRIEENWVMNTSLWFYGSQRTNNNTNLSG